LCPFLRFSLRDAVCAHTSCNGQGIKQLLAVGGVALIGITLVPLLSGLFG
ncbi:Maff2 family mobile element protein, partial [Faecalibacterium prausnitzii]